MKYLLIVISIFSLSLMDISASEYEGLVVKVTDGDSVKIKVGEITNTIRLLYIDAPEGFVERNNRPLALQKGILARLPPMISSSPLILELSSTIVV